MAITEETRHRLFQRLEVVLGAEEAATLMEHLPPVGWADVATKRDLDHLEAVTRRDIEALAATTSRDIEALAASTKRDIEALAATTSRDIEALRGAVADLDARMRAEFERAGERVDAKIDLFTATIRAELHREIRVAVLTSYVGFASLAGVVVAAVGLS